MSHDHVAPLEAARLLKACHDELRMALEGRASPYADSIAVAIALLARRPLDVAAARRLRAAAAAGPAGEAVRAIEARHWPDARDGIILRRLATAGPASCRTRPPEDQMLALDMLDIGEGASAGLREAAAGARLAMRRATIPGYSLAALVVGTRPPVDADEADDLLLFRALPIALALARAPGRAVRSIDAADVLATGRLTPSGMRAAVAPAAAAVPTLHRDWTVGRASDNRSAEIDMATVTTSPLLLDALALTGTPVDAFVADRVRELGSRPAAWTGAEDWPATADGLLRVSMLRLMDGRLEALVRFGKATLVSEGDQVAVTTGFIPHSLESGCWDKALSALTDIPVLTRPDNVVLGTRRAGDRLLLTVAAPAVEVDVL